ncbi:MAG: DUF6262 family protein [Pseudonocardiaceae bacterium]
MTPNRTTAAIQARRQNTQAMLQRVQDAITTLHRHKTPVSFAAVARRAHLSRTFLYENPNARSAVADAIDRTDNQREHTQTERDDQQEASWRERALNAEEALKTAHTEIRVQRDRMATLMGTIRDLEQDQPSDSAERTTTENTTLKHRVQQLTQENRVLEERLQAARSNLRFQDRRLADLEARLLEQPGTERPR